MRPRNLTTILVTAFVLSSAACSCSRDLKYTVPSPSQTRTARVAVENCGATTGFTTVVSVGQKRLGVVPVSRDLFIAGGELVGERYLALHWESDNELVVTIHSTERIQRLEHPFSGLVVRYEGNPNFGS